MALWEKNLSVHIAVPPEDRVKIKEIKKNDKYFDPAWKVKNPVKHEVNNDTNYQ